MGTGISEGTEQERCPAGTRCVGSQVPKADPTIAENKMPKVWNYVGGSKEPGEYTGKTIQIKGFKDRFNFTNPSNPDLGHIETVSVDVVAEYRGKSNGKDEHRVGFRSITSDNKEIDAGHFTYYNSKPYSVTYTKSGGKDLDKPVTEILKRETPSKK